MVDLRRPWRQVLFRIRRIDLMKDQFELQKID